VPQAAAYGEHLGHLPRAGIAAGQLGTDGRRGGHPEHGLRTEGCAEWPGTVERLRARTLPHIGWNTVEVPAGSTLFAGILAGTRFYFVHSYGVRDWAMPPSERLRAPLVTWSAHEGDRFVAAVENLPLAATQFHPEKSADAGAALLENWLATL